MITIIYSTHKDSEYNNKFRQHLLQSVGLKNVQILEYQNNNEYSLSELYNRGIEESEFNVLVCCHNDITLENGWGKKLLKDFSNNPEFGIIGKAGSCYFPESGVYWEKLNETMVGQVYHHPEGQKKFLSEYSSKFPFIIPVVTIDGLFISFDKRKIKHRFDETIGRFHFYDHGFCVPNYLDGIKIGVTTSFDITHQSVGIPNQEFFTSKDKFVEKYKEHLPLDLKPETPYFVKLKKRGFKNIGRVGIIIPTIGNVEMLFECVNSFYQNCNSDLFDIFIADTGSSEEEKEWIKSNISPLGNITLIEYDYYNFSKINNDVVNNHLTDKYEFVLFCNNDIKVLNDVVTGMLTVYQNNDKVGTVGSRLHFEDGTVQHDGMFLYMNQKNKSITVTHRNKFSYYKYTNSINEVVGNTAALMMVRKQDFIRIGMFNEEYQECFEDVELNLKFVCEGKTNYLNSYCSGLHYESKTRDVSFDNLNIRKDYTQTLFPFIRNNFEKIKRKMYIEN